MFLTFSLIAPDVTNSLRQWQDETAHVIPRGPCSEQPKFLGHRSSNNSDLGHTS